MIGQPIMMDASVQALFYHPLNSEMDPSEIAGEAGLEPLGVAYQMHPWLTSTHNSA
jgi:hypothetical protein